MNEKQFKTAFYIVLFILISIFFTKDIDLFEKDFYEDVKEVKTPYNILVLVNKNNKLPASFIPKDLEAIDIKYANEGKMLRKEAKLAFETLSYDASILGYKITAISAYRSYEYQEKLYNNYVLEKGDAADFASARPGHSEHQTGLALDVEGSNQDYDHFEDSKEFEWMLENAHLYGFILRYPKGKEEITGFKYEPWHYRYVGSEIARIIYDQNITLEEYIQNNSN